MTRDRAASLTVLLSLACNATPGGEPATKATGGGRDFDAAGSAEVVPAATGASTSAPLGARPDPAKIAADRRALAATATSIVERIRTLEIERDVTCWTSFRQLDNFIASKQYDDAATLTKIVATKALAHAVWAAASARASGDSVTGADVEAVFRDDTALAPAKAAGIGAFGPDLGMQDFKDYRTTSEHWRVLQSVVHDELLRPQPVVEPLAADGEEALAIAVTRMSLALLETSGQIAVEARTPLIEPAHVKLAYDQLRRRWNLSEVPSADGAADPSTVSDVLEPLTGQLIDAKVEALQRFNKAGEDLAVELGKISKIPLQPGAVESLRRQLRDFAGFFAAGYEPMRADNYLAAGNFAPKDLAGRAYLDAPYVENTTLQLFPYLMMPNGDVKLRFELRPGHPSARDLLPQDVLLRDDQMNAVRDTAIHWLVLRDLFAQDRYAMDPFAAEYLSELVSIVATLWLRRAQTLARQTGASEIDAETMGAVQDVGYVMVMPQGEAHAEWTPQKVAAKAKALASYGGPRFADATAAWGLPSSVGESVAADPGAEGFDIQEPMGAGIAIGDVDGDGFTDLYLAGRDHGRLWLNQPEGTRRRFVDATQAWGLPRPVDDGRGAIFLDFDGDGDLDLLAVRSREPSLLLENRGGKLVDVAAARGLVTGRGAHVATAFDYDEDGDLDVYVGYYGSAACNRGECDGRNLPSVDGRNGTANQLFRNDGDRFTEVGAAAKVADEGWTLAASTVDYDQDGDLDLYLANDFGQNPFFRNEGDGTFTEIAQELGAADRGSGMNVSFADVDGNGFFDIYVSNIDMFSKTIKVVFPVDESVVSLSDKILRSFQYISGNKLYLNVAGDRGRRFDAAEGLWFEPGDRGWGWAGLFFDYENDGDEDFYLTNGWIPGSPAADQKNQFFVRDREAFWLAQPDDAPEAFAGNSRAAVALDLEHDGDVDLVVGNFGQPPRVLENVQSRGGSWLGLRLRGKGTNTRAVGAVVTIRAGKRTMLRQVTCGLGYLGQDDELVHVGLGPARAADVTVVWPDGSTSEGRKLRANEIHSVQQPG